MRLLSLVACNALLRAACPGLTHRLLGRRRSHASLHVKLMVGAFKALFERWWRRSRGRGGLLPIGDEIEVIRSQLNVGREEGITEDCWAGCEHVGFFTVRPHPPSRDGDRAESSGDSSSAGVSDERLRPLEGSATSWFGIGSVPECGAAVGVTADSGSRPDVRGRLEGVEVTRLSKAEAEG